MHLLTVHYTLGIVYSCSFYQYIFYYKLELGSLAMFINKPTSAFVGRPPNITLRVMSRIEQPFVMLRKQKSPNEVHEGNDRFEVMFGC